MTTQSEPFISVPLEKIVYNRYQPRTDMDPAEIENLADSISRNGMMQKPTARPQPDGCCELAFGHRRFEAYKILAAKDAAFKTMPLITRELSDQQMFEFAWEENREREDLNPVDQGEAYATYMRVFNATSKQAGEYFRVSEETIRQKQRYGKLPEPVKQKMRDGEINENTARALLSMQKIASNEALAQTVKVIEKERENATPEEVIEDAIGHLKDVVDMWDSNRKEGKPRSAWSNGWLLDMKNFPNHLLPAMSVEQVGAYEKHIEHLVNPPACTACPFHTQVRGSHYCGLKICYERKTEAWHRDMIQQASKNLGIAVYEKEDGRYVALDNYDHKSLFNSKHKGLRLIPTGKAGGRAYQYFDGISSEVALVVATGEAIEKMKSRGGRQSAGGKMTEAEKAERRRMKIYRMRRREFMWEFTAVAKTIFDGVPYEALLKINRWEHVLVDDEPPTKVIVPDNAKVDDHKTEYQRRMLVWRLIMHDSSHYRRNSMADMLKGFEKHAKDWGVKIPKSLIKKAEEWDAEIKAAGERKMGK
jgi:ParB/RepB/Spo0J family partition protein